MKQQLANAKKYKDVIREEKDLTGLVGAESDFDVEEALRQVLTYYAGWKDEPFNLFEQVGISDERVTRHLNTEIIHDRISPLLSVGIKDFPNEAGYFMLWELSLSDKASARRILPVFINKDFVLRPMAGKKIMDVFLDPHSVLSVKSVPNLSQEEYGHIEDMCQEFAYDTFLDLKSKQEKRNQETYDKYMYALNLRMAAAEQIGIENIKTARLRRLEKERTDIIEAHRAGQKILPDFRLALLVALEA